MKRFFSRLFSTFRPRRRIAARYDAAAFSPATYRHWINAELSSANAAASPAVRRTLRARCRYEVANNPTAAGMALTLAASLIGTGPRLQLYLSDDQDADRVEEQWAEWADQIRLAQKLRIARMAQFQDGESFLVLFTNPKLETPVKLDIRLIEADRVCDPDPNPYKHNNADGITFDEYGNPTSYTVLRQHPGDAITTDPGADVIPAEDVIHLYRPTRPEQARGIPDLTPGLPLFALLREWTLATVDAAKAAAAVAGVIYTDSPPGGESAELEPLDPVQLERNTLMTLPQGWRVEQIEARYPGGTYAEGVTVIEKQSTRFSGMPYTVATADSSDANYASGRLDLQNFWKIIEVERSDLERNCLNRILRAWLSEAALIPGYLPTGYGPPATWRHAWFWDGREHVDPLKEANAQKARLDNMTTTLATEYAKQGRDWKQELRQRAREQALLQELGLTPEPIGPANAT